ncbi:MAG: class I SAM-dependent methyltransferase [Promethearchaeota archaeon]
MWEKIKAEKNLENDENFCSTFANSFFNLIWEEIKNSEQLYGKNNSEILKRYYFNLIKDEQYFRYIRYFYVERLLPLLKNINKNLKILDAGCGLGTEAILCGILGSEVTGIDISKERLDLAMLRKKFFEKQYNKEIKVSFSYENILKHFNKYDIIWVNEAISHITPFNSFMKMCYNNLDKQGKLIISDANKLNPYIYLQSKKDQIRSGGVYKKLLKEDLERDEHISYAVERIFSIPKIISMITPRFEIIEVKKVRYLPYLIFKFNSNTFLVLEKKILRKIPIFNLFSSAYVIVSRKRN